MRPALFLVLCLLPAASRPPAEDGIVPRLRSRPLLSGTEEGWRGLREVAVGDEWMACVVQSVERFPSRAHGSRGMSYSYTVLRRRADLRGEPEVVSGGDPSAPFAAHRGAPHGLLGHPNGPGHLTVGPRGEVLFVRGDRTEIERVHLDGGREVIPLPSTDGARPYLEVHGLYPDGAVVRRSDGRTERFEFLPFEGWSRFGEPFVLTGYVKHELARLLARELFVRDGARLCWIDVEDPARLAVADLERRSLSYVPVESPGELVLDGLYGDVLLAHSSDPSGRFHAALFVDLEAGTTRALLAPRPIHRVLPEGILMAEELWDPVTGRRFLHDVPFTAERPVARRRGADGGRELWFLASHRGGRMRADVLPLSGEPAYGAATHRVDLEKLGAWIRGPEDPNSAREIRFALGELRRPLGPEEVALLAGALGYDDTNVRVQAAGLLGFDGGEPARAALLAAIRVEESHWVRRVLAEALARSLHPGGTAAILAAFPPESLQARGDTAEHVAMALGLLGDPAALERVEACAERAPAAARLAADAIRSRPAVLALLAELRAG